MLPSVSKGTLQKWLRIQKWGDYPGLSNGALNVISRVLVRERQESQRKKGRKCGDGSWEVGVMHGRGHASKLAGSLQQLEKARKQIPLDPRKEHSPANLLTLAQWSRFWTSDLRNRERLNLCCFKFGDLLQQQWEINISFSNYPCLCSSIPPPTASHNLPFILKRLSFKRHYISGIIQYVTFWNWFPHLASAQPNSLEVHLSCCMYQ